MHSFIVLPSSGTKGTTSVAPMRGCSPVWTRRSILSFAFAIARNAASEHAAGGPTKVTTARLWLASRLWSISFTPATERIAPRISSTTCGRRPSLKLGTHSTRLMTGNSAPLDLAAPSDAMRGLALEDHFARLDHRRNRIAAELVREVEVARHVEHEEV